MGPVRKLGERLNWLGRRAAVAHAESTLRRDQLHALLRVDPLAIWETLLDLPSPAGPYRVAESARRREAEWTARVPREAWRDAPSYEAEYAFAHFHLQFTPDGGVTLNGGAPGRWMAAGGRLALTVPDPKLKGEWQWAGPIGPHSMLLLGSHSRHELTWHEEFRLG